MPIVISAPHGGELAPDEIPADPDTLPRDGGSLESARLVREYLRELTGGTPHLIINHLTRNRLNANTNREDASFGNEFAAQAYDEFHAYIADAVAWVQSACGKGHYFDYHTNAHDEGWVELGLGLDAPALNLTDAELAAHRNESTWRSLANSSSFPFAEIVRGTTSLGGLLEAEGIKVVPGPLYPTPGTSVHYFSGGFNTWLYGSFHGGTVDGTQIETHTSYINDGVEKREQYSRSMARAIRTFVETYYGFDLTASTMP